MKITTLIIVGLVGVTMLGMASQQASAADFYFCSGGNGNWSDTTAWYEESSCTTQHNAVPGVNDAAFILVDCDIDDANATCSHIDVSNSVTLDILVGGKLTLTASTSGTSALNASGIILLSTSTSDLSITDNDHTFSGSGGSIQGNHASAEILIDTGRKLTLANGAIIVGMLNINTITGTTTFENQGLVHANAAGTLLVNTSIVEDTSAGEWRVSASGATLQFDPAGASQSVLDGDFTVSGGTLDVESPGLDTAGRLSHTGGTIDASDLSGSEVAKFTG